MSNVVAQLLGVVLRCVLKPKKRGNSSRENPSVAKGDSSPQKGSQDLKEGGKE